MTTDLETLRQLREDAHDALDKASSSEEWDFYSAAYAALGPDGCVTKELERLTGELDACEQHVKILNNQAKTGSTSWDDPRVAQLEASLERSLADHGKLCDELHALRRDGDALRAEVKRLKQANSDLSDQLSELRSDRQDLVEDVEAHLAERQPFAKSISTLSPCPRCGETVPTTFKAGVLTYQCLKCAEDAL